MGAFMERVVALEAEMEASPNLLSRSVTITG
jgi:hypothetical protein